MDIYFTDPNLEATCGSERAMSRAYGANNAKKLKRRLEDLASGSSLWSLRNMPGNLKSLQRDLVDHFSVRLDGGWRLIFRPYETPPPTRNDGSLDWERISSILIISIEDYHD